MPIRSAFLAGNAISNEEYAQRQQESEALIASLATAIAPLTSAWVKHINGGPTVESPMTTARAHVTQLLADHVNESAEQIIDRLVACLNAQSSAAQETSNPPPKTGDYAYQFASTLVGDIFALKRGEQVRHYPGFNVAP